MYNIAYKKGQQDLAEKIMREREKTEIKDLKESASIIKAVEEKRQREIKTAYQAGLEEGTKDGYNNFKEWKAKLLERLKMEEKRRPGKNFANKKIGEEYEMWKKGYNQAVRKFNKRLNEEKKKL